MIRQVRPCRGPNQLLQPVTLPNGNTEWTEPKSVLKVADATEDPRMRLKAIYHEVFDPQLVAIPDAVEALFSSEALFATDDMGDQLRVPKQKVKAVDEALEDVTSTMPRNYGDQYSEFASV